MFFSFWATFNSFVNARYSDISVDCNDFEAGFLKSVKIPVHNVIKTQNTFWLP
jgi:hypothetical protein